MLKRIYIEITNRCNLKCSFCKDTTNDKKDISLKEFEDILLNINHLTDYLYLHIHGEPLLHHNFEGILNLCDKYNYYIQLVTNGTLLNKYPNILKHKSLRKLSISFQSIEYSNININDLFNTIFNISKDLKDNQYLEYRLWRSDLLSLPRSKEVLEIIHNNYELKETKRKNSYELAKNIYLSLDNIFSWPDLDNEKEDKGTCLGLIDQVGILVNGKVVPCCMDVNGDIELGDIFKDKLINIINNDKSNNIRENFKKNVLIEDLCKTCGYRKRFK